MEQLVNITIIIYRIQEKTFKCFLKIKFFWIRYMIIPTKKLMMHKNSLQNLFGSISVSFMESISLYKIT